MKRFYEMGGIIAGVILVLFGVAMIAMGIAGRSEVRSDVKREAIVGTPDMTPDAIKKEAAAAGLKNVDLPTCSVAGKLVSTGDEAKCFASYMRIHTLEATGGLTYSQMGRYLGKDGKGTDDASKAQIDPKTNQPVANSARDLWVTETALSTALNTSFFAERVAMFTGVVGFALLLVGVGFLVMAYLGILRARQATEADKTSTQAKNPLPSA